MKQYFSWMIPKWIVFGNYYDKVSNESINDACDVSKAVTFQQNYPSRWHLILTAFLSMKFAIDEKKKKIKRRNDSIWIAK